jgi:hypothetical protein
VQYIADHYLKQENHLEAYVSLDFNVSTEDETLMKEIKKAAWHFFSCANRK